MSEKKRRTVTTIETHESWATRWRAPMMPEIRSAVCSDSPEMLTPQKAAQQAGVSQRTVYRWVDDGLIHFAETTKGDLYVCLAPLAVDTG